MRGAGGVDGMRARGVGRASGAPIVDLGVLVPVSMTEKRQVTSTPEQRFRSNVGTVLAHSVPTVL